MNWRSYLAIICTLISVIGSTIYIIDTLKGKTKPNRVTYLFWSVPVVAGAASLSEGFSWANIMTFNAGIMPFLCFLTSFVNKNAYWKLGKTDYTCALFALVAIVLWITFENPILTITFSIIADILASAPTLIKCYKHPETETKISYFIYAMVCSINLLTVTTWSYVESAFPVYLATLNSALALCVYYKNLSRRK